MEIIIEHSNTKRKISGAFNICGSRKDLEKLSEAIEHALGAEFYYGWVKVIAKALRTQNLPHGNRRCCKYV